MVFFVCLLLLLLPTVSAQRQATIPLLALIVDDSEQQGSVATLTLEVQPGKNRVFLETFPLTRTSTQISMRFAQQIACKELDLDCKNFDFFYIITAAKGIVGGPSAGAAAAVLTASLLQEYSINNDVAITGTINSGGIIGHVGGIPEKIDAAISDKKKIVLIPFGSRYAEHKGATIDLVSYGKQQEITVVEVKTLDEALSYFTKHKPRETNISLQFNSKYQEGMKKIAEALCSRKDYQINQTFIEQAQNATNNDNYYAAASFCYRGHLKAVQDEYVNQDFSNEHLLLMTRLLFKKIELFKQEFSERPIYSLEDLQVAMAVEERYNEALERLEKIKEQKTFEDKLREYVYASERFFSAKSWLKLYKGDKTYTFSKQKLKQSCESKILEAEERLDYIDEVIPNKLDSIADDIAKAKTYYENKSYASCINDALKSKAKLDSFLSSVGANENSFNNILEAKLEIVKHALIKVQEQNPILAYSTYQYALALKDLDPQSAYLFAEYALAYSDLDLYFDIPKKLKQPLPELLVSTFEKFRPYLIGFVIGIGIILLLTLGEHKTHHATKRKE